MLKIIKWLIVLAVVIYLVYLALANMAIVRYELVFDVPLLFADAYHTPQLPLGLVLGLAVLGGALVTGLAAIVQIFGLRRRLWRANRRNAQLEEEVVAYRGRAATESDMDEDDEEDEDPAY